MRTDVRHFSIGAAGLDLMIKSRIDGSYKSRFILRRSPYFRGTVERLSREQWDQLDDNNVRVFFPLIPGEQPSHKVLVNGEWLDVEKEQSRDEAESSTATGARAEERRVVSVVTTQRHWAVICQSRDLNRLECHEVPFVGSSAGEVVNLITDNEHLLVCSGARAIYTLSGFVPCPFCGADNDR